MSELNAISKKVCLQLRFKKAEVSSGANVRGQSVPRSWVNITVNHQHKNEKTDCVFL